MTRCRSLLVALLLLGCSSEPAGPQTADSSEAQLGIASSSPSPSDEAGVLALLAPVVATIRPSDPEAETQAIELRYEITGPGGLVGELVTLHAAGGWRSERWTMTGGEGQLEVQGQTIATPRMRWTATGEQQPGERMEVHLGALADAWLALSSERRDAAFANLQAWRAELAKSRIEQPGETETIQGVRCVKMRIATQNLCLWEEAGLLMRYEGAAFELLVTSVTRNPTIPSGAFELPPRAKAATVAPVEPIDAPALIEGLADGKVGPVAALVGPGMPTLAKPAQPQPPGP